METIFIYLSGTIRKSHDTDKLSQWEDHHLNLIQNLCLQKNVHIQFLNPASRSDDLSDIKSLFGRDILQVYLSNFVLVDVREKRGIGVGYEIAFANFKSIPVISWAEKDSHYRPLNSEVLGQNLKNWIHPFVLQPSTMLASSLEEAVNFINSSNRTIKKPIELTDYVTESIKHYLNTQFLIDKEMHELVSNHNYLKEEIEKIINL